MVFNTQNTSLANTIFQRCGPMFKKVLFFTFYFYVTTHHKVLRKWTNLFKSPFSQHDSYSQADFQTKTLHFLFCMHKPWGLKRTIWKAMKGTFHPDVLFNQYLFNLQHFKFRWSCKKALNWWRNEMHFFSFPWPIIIWSIYSFIEKKPIAEKRIFSSFWAFFSWSRVNKGQKVFDKSEVRWTNRKVVTFWPWHTLKVGYFRTKKILDKLTKLSILYWRHISKRLKHIFFEKVHSWHFLTQFLVYIFFFHSGFFLMINDWFFSTIGQQFFWVAFEIVFP